ncbi:caspase [Ogataea polymorpha]|uniref:caspase n=1 Tax=Ogataea polymorpha TaxID=460523 RepID=UPI0007F3F839|nr:caspase [Ogataea polymorpha]OBA17196.1 caspase [Ogataea polymorpha]
MYPGNSHANYGNQYQRPSGPPPSRIYQPPAGAPPSRQYERPPAPPPNWGNQQTQTYQGTGGVSYQQPTQQPPMPNFNMQNQQINGTNNVQQFQYSSCTGRKKALLVGINYIGTSNALRGCINDVHNMFNFLTQTQGYKAEDIVMLTDDQRELVKVPTKANMIRAMQWLVKDARPGDSLFFHYSGHGGQEEDQDGDEEDGYDDCIYPVDFQQTGSLVDDVMHDIMVKSLPAGCRLTCIFDSCHSGTALDLPFCYRAQDGGIKEYNVWKESSGDALNLVTGYLTRNTGLMMNSVSNVFKRIKATSGSRAEQIKQAKMSPADVIMFSGCKDSQTSADANESGSFTGALSYAFIKVLRENPIQSYLTLLQNIRAVLAQKYTQKPQLSSSHQIDPNVRFIM